jgi:predicted dehydrogenase
VGCYPIGYACYLTEETPVEVFGHQLIGPTGIDLLFVGQLRFPSSIISQFDSSFTSEYKVEIELTGDKGRITIPEPYKPGKSTKIYLRKSGEGRTIKIKGKDLYLGEVEDLECAILENKPPRISLSQSREIVQSIEALYLSAHLSKLIKTNDLESRKLEPVR